MGIKKVRHWSDGGFGAVSWSARDGKVAGPTPFSNTYSVIFDGADETCTAGDVLDFESNTAFSLSIWFKTTEATNFQVLFSKVTTSPAYHGYRIAMLNTGLMDLNLVSVTGASAQIRARSTGAYNDGDWHHAVWTYDGSRDISGCTLYMDGSSVSLTTVGNTLDTATTVTSGPLRLSGQGETAAFFFDGSIDEPSVWNKEATSTDVGNMRSSGAPADLSSHPAVANCVGWWRMGDDSGDSETTFVDQIGSNNFTGVNLESGDIQADVP